MDGIRNFIAYTSRQLWVIYVATNMYIVCYRSLTVRLMYIIIMNHV